MGNGKGGDPLYGSKEYEPCEYCEIAHQKMQELEQDLKATEDCVRFLCETWDAIDTWAYSTKDITKYPVIQGTKNQNNLGKVGQQAYHKENIAKTINRLLQR